ncbi:MAG: PH domain-containing protein [Patescibacteria group bacterium]
MNVNKLLNQKGYEKIARIVRRHWITFLPMIIFFILLLAIPLGIYWLLINTASGYLQDPIYYTIGILFASIYYLSVILFFYTYFVEFHLDLWIVTNDRLLDIQQKTLFARTVSEVDLYQIQDTSSEIHGIFPSIFNYGDIILQTASAVPKFIFRNVPNPHGLRRMILDLAAEDKKFHDQ